MMMDRTLQQFREAIGCEHDYRFVIEDRDDKFSADLRRSLRGMGVRPLRTPRRAPQANAYCERLIGTTRRECLDFLIPLSEEHLHRLLTEWRDYYNRARPHSSLGPCLPTCAFYLFIRQPHGSEVNPAARNSLDSAPIPTASKLLICGLFQKGRVLAQDGKPLLFLPRQPGSALPQFLSAPLVVRHNPSDGLPVVLSS